MTEAHKRRELTTHDLRADDTLKIAMPILDAHGRILVNRGVVLDEKGVGAIMRSKTDTVIVEPVSAPDYLDELNEFSVDLTDQEQLKQLDRMYKGHLENPNMALIHRVARARLRRRTDSHLTK